MNSFGPTPRLPLLIWGTQLSRREEHIS